MRRRCGWRCTRARDAPRSWKPCNSRTTRGSSGWYTGQRCVGEMQSRPASLGLYEKLAADDTNAAGLLRQRSTTALKKMAPDSREPSSVSLNYCTFASTCESAFNVKVQLLALLPPLEHAPDQIASRPLETVRVTDVPCANGAVEVLPTAALIPAGVELTVSPWRPPAVTLRFTVDGAGAAGLSVSVAERVTPPPETEMVTSVWVLTWLVLMLNPACTLPAGISTVL